MNHIKKTPSAKVNPYDKGSLSWKIWDRNNNPNSEQFWIDKFARNITKRDEIKVNEVLANAV